MDKKKLGTKRVCLGCGARFYDFGRKPIICPTCGMEYDPEYLSKKKSRTLEDAVKDDIVLEDDIMLDDQDDAILDEDADTADDEDVVSIDDIKDE